MSSPQPLLLMKGGSEFLYPNEENGIISMTHGTEFEIHCPGTSNGFQNHIAANNVNSIVTKCAGGKQVSIPNAINLKEIKCMKEVNSMVKRIPGKKCNHNRNDIIEIGFEIRSEWLRLIEVCHDSVKSETLWVHYVMQPRNDVAQTVRRPKKSGERDTDFVQGEFYPKIRDVNSLYTTGESEKSLHRILGDQRLVDELIEKIQPQKKIITRGHLAAASDFMYQRQQVATFQFLNCAPQWVTFNRINWNDIEKMTRSIVNRVNEKAEIYTGTYGVMMRANHELYLAENVVAGTIERSLPIPKLFYKMIIMPALKKGIVFIGVNDHQATQRQLDNEYHLCNNIMDGIAYINNAAKAKLQQVHNGFIYACDVDSFLAGLREKNKETLPAEIPKNLTPIKNF